MKSSSTCAKCQKEIFALQIAKYWPSKIRCKNCSALHYIRFGNIIGILYFFLIIVSAFIPIAYSSNFENVNNGIHSTSALQLGVKFGGIAIMYLLVGYIYGKFIKKFFILRTKNP